MTLLVLLAATLAGFGFGHPLRELLTIRRNKP